MSFAVMVVAKAPVPRRVKTRLAVTVGEQTAAEIAAACLLDTVAMAGQVADPSRCVLSLAGSWSGAVRANEIRDAVRGWRVLPQRGANLSKRLANSYLDWATLEAGPDAGPVVQVGMDTPQLTAADYAALGDSLMTHDAVIGPALDGGWWALAVRSASFGAVLADVPMSQSTTCVDTFRALRSSGLNVARGATHRDLDDAADLSVLTDQLRPSSELSRLVRALGVPS